MNKLYFEFLKSLKNKKIMVCGLGLSNKYIIKTFHDSGAKVIACDARDKSEIPLDILKYIQSEQIEYRLGKNYLDKMDCEIIIRTPGMNFLSDALINARKLGIVVTSEMEIFFDFCPCKIIGITGSDGKTTVTTIIYEILKKSGKKVFLGGNIGVPLLSQINDIGDGDIVVAELSSFQLISMRKSPHVAVVTNLSPNHLDVHKDMDEYTSAKKNIFVHQNAFGEVILNHDNPITRQMSKEARGDVVFFSRLDKLSNGVWIDKNENIIFSKNSYDQIVINKNSIKLPGNHNLENYLAAIAAIFKYTNKEIIKNFAENFSGVAHRMEFVRTVNKITYYNDSIATTPNRVISGCLSLFPKKIVLIAGGYDKHIPFNELGDFINKKVKILILLGQTADKIELDVKSSTLYTPQNINIIKVDNMETALKEANSHCIPGDIVVLSPACASFGMYKNFEERGNHFKKIVNKI